MKSSYIFNEGEYLIRPMLKNDVFSYLNLFGYDIQTRNGYYKIYKDIFKNQKEDDTDLFFVILKNGKIIGEIATKALLDSPCDASVRIVLPQHADETKKVEELFEKFCLETYLYDDIYIMKPAGGVKKIMISARSKRKTS